MALTGSGVPSTPISCLLDQAGALCWDWALCNGDGEACAQVLGGLLLLAPGWGQPGQPPGKWGPGHRGHSLVLSQPPQWLQTFPVGTSPVPAAGPSLLCLSPEPGLPNLVTCRPPAQMLSYPHVQLFI